MNQIMTATKVVAADQMLPTSGSLLLESLRLTSYAVLHDALSLHLRGEIPRADVSELLDQINQVTRGRYYVPGSLAVSGDPSVPVVTSRFSVSSVTSRAGAAMLLLRAPKGRKLVNDLLELVGDTELALQLGSPQSLAQAAGPSPDGAGSLRADVQRLLVDVARERGVPSETLLEQLTAFVGQRGPVAGKRSLADVSDKQLTVVRDRLGRLQSERAQTRGRR
jgi:hypothetical protein